MSYDEYIQFVETIEDVGWMIYGSNLDENEVPTIIEMTYPTTGGIEMLVQLERSPNSSFADSFKEYAESYDYDKQLKLDIIDMPDFRNNFSLEDALIEYKEYDRAITRTIYAIS